MCIHRSIDKLIHENRRDITKKRESKTPIIIHRCTVWDFPLRFEGVSANFRHLALPIRRKSQIPVTFKSRISTEISNFGEYLKFRQKSWISTKIANFEDNLRFR